MQYLQNFYESQLGIGNKFSLQSPIVEIYQTTHPASYYPTHQSSPGSEQAGWFYQNVVSDGFQLTGGGFNDPNNRWIFYIDSDIACTQYIGANSGVAVLASNDLRGLTGQQYVPNCPNGPVDNGPPSRWIGGLGHELAHTFLVPHPAGCDAGNCIGGTFAGNSLMWTGFIIYPNTYFLPCDRQALLSTGFFSIPPNAYVSVHGQLTTTDGRGVAGALISLTDQNNGVVRYGLSNSFGHYRFTEMLSGRIYTIQPKHKRNQFNSSYTKYSHV